MHLEDMAVSPTGEALVVVKSYVTMYHLVNVPQSLLQFVQCKLETSLLAVR